MPPSRRVAEKAEEVEEIKGLIHQYSVLGMASLQKVRANQLQELRTKLADTALLRVTKNTVIKRAIDQCGDKPGLKEFEENLSGPSIFLFTNLNPFRLVLILQKSRVKTVARAGDVASQDVIVPAGNTGLPPGRIISQLNAAGLATRIETGSVWINRETVVAKKGEVIDETLASVLSKLGIKPVDAGLTMRMAYDDGTLITEEQMQIDLEEIRSNVEEAHASAFNLSLSAAYPLPENINLLLQRTHQEAYRLAINASVTTRDTMADLVMRAHMEMLSLSRRIAMTKEEAAPADTVQKG